MKLQYCLILFLIACSGCGENYPKPKGLLRIDETANFKKITEISFAEFEVISGSDVKPAKEQGKELWLNIIYPDYHVQLYGTYCRITKNNLTSVTDDFYKLLYRNMMDEEFDYSLFEDEKKSVFAHLFVSNAAVASPVQFFITDSAHHFFRGAVYFTDSLPREMRVPYTDFMVEETAHLLETFNWKN